MLACFPSFSWRPVCPSSSTPKSRRERDKVRARPRIALAGLLLGAACGILTACVAVPDVSRIVEGPTAAAASPRLVAARGPLTGEQSKAVITQLRQQGDGTDVLRRHLAIEEAVAGSPLIVGNRTKVLRDGTETFKAIFSAISGAKDHVNLEYYILQDVSSDGQRLSDLLIAKRRAGVRVNVIYDSYGSTDTSGAFFDKLKTAGVNLVDFNPLNPLDAKNGYSPNARDHRKILVVDGRKAILGGVNLSTTYEGGSFSGATGADVHSPERWRDTDIEIEGPAVSEVQKLFLETWRKQSGPALDDNRFFPAVPSRGDEIVRIIGSTPDDAVPRYYTTLLSAIGSADRRVWLTTAYFVPTDQEVEGLIKAARRGVDVRLLLPADSDSALALARGHSHYEDLLKSGVKIFELHDEVLHSKTVVVDGVWSAIGSSNFDHRSILFNDEIDAIILGHQTAAQLENFFEEDLRRSTSINREAWEDRPIGQKIGEGVTLFWEDLL